MKNTIIILAFAFSICFGKGIEQRQSFSDTKQVAVEKKQGGTLLRFDHASLGDSAWQCTELFVPPNTKPEELQAFRDKATAEKRPFLFREHRPETFDTWDGKKPLRFKVPEIKRYKWVDAVRGNLEAGEEALDDRLAGLYAR